MSAQPLTIHIVTQRLEGEVLLAEPILFPLVQLCHTSDAELTAGVRRLVLELASKLSPLDWHRHVLADTPIPGRIVVTIDPPKRQQTWNEPLDCAFDYIRWQHGDHTVAYVPALRIAVIAESLKHLEKVAPGQIRSALRRQTGTDTLYRLALLRRVESIALHSSEMVVGVQTPKQRHSDRADDEAKKQKPLIQQVGEVLTDATLDPAYEMEQVVARMAESLAGRLPRSVLLVGPAGVGKTAAVRELVRNRGALGLGETLFWTTSGARLVAGMSGFGMWQERCTTLVKEAKKASAIVHLGSLYELMEVGKAETIGQGIAGFLKPSLIRGDLLAIAECTPEQLTLIERVDPHLLDGFQIVQVVEPSAEAGRRIIESRAVALGRRRVNLSDDGLATLDRLHRRYAGYSAYPSRPLRFVQNLLLNEFSRTADDEQPMVTLGPAEVTAAFARQSGLPPFLLDDDMPLDVPAARATFAGRVIGQPEAVDLVADLIATVKAGLSRPRRPIASLLFIGPTGVGKTEMAKTLAEFFFSSQDRMTRFDMSEFATAIDVQRLVGGVLGAEGLLTARVREQPFSVILLDEVEKAHPLLFDLLLQVLGEGRLTDAAGRVADFTNAVVVMTSNLGAESFQRGGFGMRQGPERLDARHHFVEEVRNFLRPELFNRIDRIVPFLPLDEETIRRIVRRELDLVGRRDGILLRNVAFTPDDDVVQYLARKGYDRLYGARPLKRLIERELLVPLADGINGYVDRQRLTAEVRVSPKDELRVTVRAVADTREAAVTAAASRWADAAVAAGNLRRKVQRLFRSTALLTVQNELFSLQRAEQREQAASARKGKSPPYDADRTRRIGRLTAVTDAAEQIQRTAITLEDQALDVVHGDAAQSASPGALEAERSAAETALMDALSNLYDLRYDQPDRVTIALFGTAMHHLSGLAKAYVATAGESAELKAWWFGRSKDVLEKHASRKPQEMLANVPSDAEGVLLSLEAPHAMLRFQGETGLHEFKAANVQHEILVDVSTSTPIEYEPPMAIANREPTEMRKRREYLIDRAMAKDSRMTGELRWGGRGLQEAVAEALSVATQAALAGLLEQEQQA